MNINIKKYRLNNNYFIKCSEVKIKGGSSLYAVEVFCHGEVVDGRSGIASKDIANDVFCRLRDKYIHKINIGVA